MSRCVYRCIYTYIHMNRVGEGGRGRAWTCMVWVWVGADGCGDGCGWVWVDCKASLQGFKKAGNVKGLGGRFRYLWKQLLMAWRPLKKACTAFKGERGRRAGRSSFDNSHAFKALSLWRDVLPWLGLRCRGAHYSSWLKTLIKP